MTMLRAGDHLFHERDIRYLDVSRLQDLIVTVVLTTGETFEARDIHALELVMEVKPSAFEGLRMHWPKGVWAFHNFVGHPLMHILVWLGYPKLGFRVHDGTVPKPLGKKLK